MDLHRQYLFMVHLNTLAEKSEHSVVQMGSSEETTPAHLHTELQVYHIA